MADDARTYNVEDRIRELGEDPATAYANAKANGMAGDAPPPLPIGGVVPSVSADMPVKFAAADDQPDAPPTGEKAAVAPAITKRPELPKLAPIANTGTLFDTQEQMPNLTPVQPLTHPIEPAASWTDAFHASVNSTFRETSMTEDQVRVRDGYAPIIRALGLPDSENPTRFTYELPDDDSFISAGTSVSQLATARKEGIPAGNGSYLTSWQGQEELVADAIKARRAKDPHFLPGVPDSVDGLHKYFLEQSKKDEATDQATIARGPGGVSGFTAALAGSTVGQFEDPAQDVIMAATIPMGGEGGSILKIAARDALINTAFAAIDQPTVAHNKGELGEDYTAADAATNLGAAAVGGAAFGVVMHGVGKAAMASGIPQAIGAGVGQAMSTASRATDFLKAMPEAVRTKWGSRVTADETAGSFFSSLSNHELVEFAHDATGGKLTPDQLSAANVLERAQEVGESSPYQPGYAGDGAHEAALASAIKDLEDRKLPEPAGLPSGPTGEGSATVSPATVAERPPAPSTAGRPQPPTGPNSDPEAAIASFKAKVYHAENATGNVNAKNPRSSASGGAQFTDGTFRDYYRKVYGTDPGEHPAQELKNNPEIQGRLLDRLTRDNAAKLQSLGESLNDGNLYVMHFLGEGDGSKVFKADPSTPIDRLVSAKVLEANPFLKGKSASEVIAWAHGKMGAHVASVRAGADPLEPATEDPSIAQYNGEALQLDPEVIGVTSKPDGSPVNLYADRVPVSAINVDADRFQFKAGGDQYGVTDRLQGVTQVDPMQLGRLTLWQDHDGRMFVADGHQRTGLLQREAAVTGNDRRVDVGVLRAADGVSAEDARVMTAIKNLAEDSGTKLDAAKIGRANADALERAAARLPKSSAIIRDGKALAKLSDPAFGAVVNGRVPADYAAVIGHLLPDRPEAHEAMIDLLAKLDPANRGQAESLVRQAMAAGIHKESQVDLFGTHEHVTTLMLEKARVTEKVLAELKKMKLVHKTAAEGADALERVGSKIAKSASEKEAQANAQAIETVSRLAFRAGPIADAINDAARSLKSGGNLAAVARDAAERIRQLDLGTLAGTAADDDAGRLVPDGAGRGGDTGEAGPQLSAQSRDPEQPSLQELDKATERFSDPDGKAIKQQAESLYHDLKAGALSRRDKIQAATAALEGRGELRSVEPFPEDEPGYHRFRYLSRDGEEVTGNYTVDGNLIEGFNIGDKNNPKELGPAELRRLFDQLHELHPEVKYVHGYRMSGARTAEGAGEQEIWMELTDKGLKFSREDPRSAADVARETPPEAGGNGAPANEGDQAGAGQPNDAGGAQNASERADLGPIGGDLQAKLDAADQSLSGKAAEAIDNFVGHGPLSRDKDGAAAVGLMSARELERAIAEGGETAHAIEAAFAPVREELAAKTGPTVKLYRVQRPVERDPNVHYASRGDTSQRAVLSWTSDRKFADHHAGVDLLHDRPDVPEEKIAKAERQLEETGRADVGKGRYLERDADGSIQIYDAAVGGHVTDTDSVRAYFEDTNRYRAEDRARNSKKREAIIAADVPLSEVVWATDRAAQSEFIVRNKPGSAWFIDEHGKLSPGDKPALDRGAETDPAIAEKNRQLTELGAEAPLRAAGDVDQKGEIGLGLFDHADQPELTYRLGDEGGEISAADLLKDLEDDDKAIKAIKDCL